MGTAKNRHYKASFTKYQFFKKPNGLFYKRYFPESGFLSWVPRGHHQKPGAGCPPAGRGCTRAESPWEPGVLSGTPLLPWGLPPESTQSGTPWPCVDSESCRDGTWGRLGPDFPKSHSQTGLRPGGKDTQVDSEAPTLNIWALPQGSQALNSRFQASLLIPLCTYFLGEWGA